MLRAHPATWRSEQSVNRTREMKYVLLNGPGAVFSALRDNQNLELEARPASIPSRKLRNYRKESNFWAERKPSPSLRQRLSTHGVLPHPPSTIGAFLCKGGQARLGRKAEKPKSRKAGKPESLRPAEPRRRRSRSHQRCSWPIRKGQNAKAQLLRALL